MKRIFFITSISLILASWCGGDSNNNSNSSELNTSHGNQLNISILLDLSDRISPTLDPLAQKNDIENIRTITELFKVNMASLGAYKAKGKIKIFLKPTPANASINSTINKLMIDCSKMDNKGRKEVYDNITDLYVSNLEEIYHETIKTSDWKGSDIWRFFKVDVKDLCIEKDTNYRNILIILTDGYLYHEQSRYTNNKNRFSYLSSSNLNRYRKQNWEHLIEQDDFGIMTERNDLSNLEVLVLEIKTRSSSTKIDEDILGFLWKKWFKEMNISHCEVYPSNNPAYTKTRIENFLILK